MQSGAQTDRVSLEAILFDVRKKGINANIDENVNFVFERRQITFVDCGPHFKIPIYLQPCSLESLTTLSTLLLRCNNSLL